VSRPHDARNRSKLWARLGILGAVCFAAAGLLWALPTKNDLIWLSLYAVPSHILISPLPYEPLVLHCAKSNPLWEVTLAATSGCTIAGVIDYWLLVPFFKRRAVRDHMDGVRLFRRSQELFNRAPFWVLIFSSMLPVPSEPFKMLSVVTDYPAWKYIVALIVGRSPKYYTIAYLGYVLQPPTWLIMLLCALVLLPFLWKHRDATSPLLESSEDPEPMEGIVPAEEDQDPDQPPHEAIVQSS
jgi:membrane protein YqaA with SNARE-associated domain